MQRGGLGGVTIASRKVHAHCEIDLTTAHDIIKESVGFCYGLHGEIENKLLPDY